MNDRQKEVLRKKMYSKEELAKRGYKKLFDEEDDEYDEYDEPDYILFEGEEIPQNLPLTQKELLKKATKYGKMRYEYLKETRPSTCYNMCALGIMKEEMELASQKGDDEYHEAYLRMRKHLEKNNEENLNALSISVHADNYAAEYVYENVIKQESLFANMKKNDVK